MFAKSVVSDEEKAVDPQVGFPRGYAKLCRHAHIQARGLISPFTEGPPQRFQPYAIQDEEIAMLKEYDDVFPLLNEGPREAIDTKKHIDYLWQQLDHMANAGFDPAIFRIDTYGNVLYWDADPGSPLAWDIDHWFPKARGGKTVPTNLRLVQWQACQRKGKNLEFLVPWWDLHIGVSVNQFLSVFASKNTSFRQRAFFFFFLFGENEELENGKVCQGHSWPRLFKDRKNQVGLAAAAIVQKQNSSDLALQTLQNNCKAAKPGDGFARSGGNRDDDVKKDFQVIVDHWKSSNIKPSRKEERASDKENKDQNALVPLQLEQHWKQLISVDKRYKLEESLQLDEELQLLKAQNVREKAILEQLEKNLSNQKKRVEKQRRWSETQSQYRLCLEKMIRDTLHQCVVYKEQARLNQVACNALLARLDSQKSACDAAEEELAQKIKQREDLEASTRPLIAKRVRYQWHTDVGSCLKPSTAAKKENVVCRNSNCDPQDMITTSQKGSNDHYCEKHEELEMGMHLCTRRQEHRKNTSYGAEMGEASPNEIASDKQELRVTCPKLQVRDKYATRALASPERDVHDVDAYGEDAGEGSQIVVAQSNQGARRRASEKNDELEVVLLGYEYQAHEEEDANREESVGDNGTTHYSILRNLSEDDEDDNGSQKNSHNNDDDYDESNNIGHNVETNKFVKSTDFSDDLHRNNHKAAAIDKRGDRQTETNYLALQACRGRNPHERTEKPPAVEKPKDDEQLDELLQEVLALQDRVNEAMVDAIKEEQDEERVKRLGKLNLDMWLKKLLLDSGYGGQDQEPTPLISFSLGEDNSLGPQGQSANVVNNVTKKSERGKLCNKEMEDQKGFCNSSSEIVGAATESMIGGLLKRLSFKNGNSSPQLYKTQDCKLVASADGSGILKESRPPAERRSSPWRWVSPVPKRSIDTGNEFHGRRLSPWRRNAKHDIKSSERKMMEDFSKLRVRGSSQVEGGIMSKATLTGEVNTFVQERQRSTSVKQQAFNRAFPHNVRERSASTPPGKAQSNHHLALTPIPHRLDDLPREICKLPMPVQYSKAGTGDDEEGAANTGASRKATMIKNCHSFKSGQKSSRTAGMSITGLAGGRSTGVSFEGGTTCGMECSQGVNEEPNVSLSKDLDTEDGLHASLSLARKKCTKKFELGRRSLSFDLRSS